jgi:hypothetical protein
MPFRLHLGANVASTAWVGGCDEQAGDPVPDNGKDLQNKPLRQQLDLGRVVN